MSRKAVAFGVLVVVGRCRGRHGLDRAHDAADETPVSPSAEIRLLNSTGRSGTE